MHLLRLLGLRPFWPDVLAGRGRFVEFLLGLGQEAVVVLVEQVAVVEQLWIDLMLQREFVLKRRPWRLLPLLTHRI